MRIIVVVSHQLEFEIYPSKVNYHAYLEFGHKIELLITKVG